MKGWMILENEGMSPGGEGVLAGKQQCAVGCRSRVLLLHPSALLLPAQAHRLRGPEADTQVEVQ